MKRRAFRAQVGIDTIVLYALQPSVAFKAGLAPIPFAVFLYSLKGSLRHLLGDTGTDGKAIAWGVPLLAVSIQIILPIAMCYRYGFEDLSGC